MQMSDTRVTFFNTHVEPTLRCTKVLIDNMSNASVVVGFASE